MWRPSKLLRRHNGVKSVSWLPFSAGTTEIVVVGNGGLGKSEQFERRVNLYSREGDKFLSAMFADFLPTQVIRNESSHKWRLFQESVWDGRQYWVTYPDGRHLWLPEAHYQELLDLLGYAVELDRALLPF